MPLALPSPYVDCDRDRNFTVSADVTFQLIAGASIHFSFGASSQLWRFTVTGQSGGGSCPPGQAPFTRKIFLQGPGYAQTQEGSDFFDCFTPPASPPERWSDVFGYSETISGARLGVKLEVLGTYVSGPVLWIFVGQVFEWFFDGYTTRQSTCAGHTGDLLYYQGAGGWGTTQNTSLTPEPASPLGKLVWGADYSGSNVGEHCVTWSNLTVDGSAADTSALDDGFLIGNQGIVDTADGGEATAWLPLRYRDKVGVLLNGGGDVGADFTTFNAGSLHTTPYDSGVVTSPWNDWTTPPEVRREFQLDDTWADGEDPPIRDDDRLLPISAHNAMFDPAGASGEPVAMTPVTATLAASLDVMQASGNAWSSPAAGELEYVLEANWRTHLSASSPEYEVQRHDWGPWSETDEDVWFWGAYCWAQPSITVPAGGAGDYTITIEGVHLEAVDDHATPRSISHTEHAFSYERVVTLAEGANTPWVDLAFYSGDHFEFPSRVDRIHIAGPDADALTISSWPLKTRESGYWKGKPGVPVSRGDYSMAWHDQDGASLHLYDPDQAGKADEIGDPANGQHGGGMPYISLLDDAMGDPLDAVLDLQTFWERLNKTSGWTVVWTQATHDAANEDSFGNSLAHRADWTRDILPSERVSGGSALTPACVPRVRRLTLVNGQEFLVRVKASIGGSVTALVSQNGARAPAGVSMEAYRTDTSAAAGTAASTDNSGFVEVGDLPADGPGGREYGLRKA